MTDARTVPRAVSVLGAAYLTAGALSVLPQAGDAVVLAAVGGAVLAAWVGVLGTVRDRPGVVAVGLLGLGAVGALDPLLWDVLLPAAAALFVAGALVAVR